MKKVDIVYDFFHQFPTVKIDNVNISQYSDLGIIESNDIHKIANKIKKIFPIELEDSYSVSVTGPVFVGRMLSALLNDDDSCTEVSWSEYGDIDSLGRECTFISSIMKKYGCANYDIPSIHITGPGAGSLSGSYLLVSEDNPDWYVKQGEDNPDNELPTVILNSDNFLIDNKLDDPVIALPSGWENDFFDYLYERTVLIPFVLNGRNTCAQLELSQGEEMTLKAYKEGRALYVFELGRDTIDAGNSCSCTFAVYPAEKSDAYKMEILPIGSASYADGRLTAHSGNTITINILDSDGKVQETHLIKVITHNYVTEVKVFPESIDIEAGEKCQFEYFPIPADAEDAGRLQLSISAPTVASVIDNRYVMGLNAGSASLQIAGDIYRGNVPIKVVPKLSGITLDENNIDVELGKERVIHCSVQPQGAHFEKPDWKLDNVKLGKISVSEDGMYCQFTATSESFATGSLMCQLPNTDFSDSCEIKIIPIQQPTVLMALAWIFTGIGCIAGLFIFPMAAANGTAFTAYFMDFFMPIGLILGIIGRRMNNPNSNGIFLGAILTNVLYALFMIIVGAAMCG